MRQSHAQSPTNKFARLDQFGAQRRDIAKRLEEVICNDFPQKLNNNNWMHMYEWLSSFSEEIMQVKLNCKRSHHVFDPSFVHSAPHFPQRGIEV
jgi:hypothetical protein